MSYSNFGQKFLGDSGTLRLMDDLGSAAHQEGVIMLGGGNPSHIPAMERIFQERMGRILDSDGDFDLLVGNYDGPGGDRAFIDAFVALMQQEYGWQIDATNVALTSGSQIAFFYLFNALAGTYPDGSHKKILLPLAPEYIGYTDSGIEDDIFVSFRPHIEYLDPPYFKYRVDFDTLEIDESIRAICVSRPTNPTGNVLTDEEMIHLSQLARDNGIPLIVDNAYGAPFPGIIFTEAIPQWEPHLILCMSLSKLGLPGTRTGIVVADAEIIRAITAMNAIINLAPSRFRPMLALDILRTGEIIRVSEEVVKPYYWRKANQAVTWLCEELGDVDFRIHKPEGAFFLWLWFKGLPISCQELYVRLKERGVLILPGHYFFPGLADEWQHRHECIRMNYAGDDDMVHAGIRMIGEEVRAAYFGASSVSST